MSVRYQHGYLRCRKRKNGDSCWEFMCPEQEPSGERVRRTAVIGTTEEYPTEELAREAVRGLRRQINEARNRQPEQAILVADLIGHYLDTELAQPGTPMLQALSIVNFLRGGSSHIGAHST